MGRMSSNVSTNLCDNLLLVKIIRQCKEDEIKSVCLKEEIDYTEPKGKEVEKI